MCTANTLILSLILAAVALGDSHSQETVARAPKTPIEDLIKQLGDKSATIRQQAAKTFARHGKAAVPALIKTVKSGSYHARIAAMHALAGIGPDAKGAIPVLIERLRDKAGSRNTFAAADALGNIGPAAAKAAPDLIRHLREDWTFFGPHIRPALAKLGPAAAVHVRQALDDRKITDTPLIPGENPLVREALNDQVKPALVAILGGYGAKHALPLLDHRLPRVRIAACRVLSAKPQALRPIVKLLDDHDANVCSVAAYCLRGYGAKAIVALEKLKALLADKQEHVRASAAWGLSGIGPGAKSARSALIAASKDKQAGLAASVALAEIGFERDAIAGYIQALKAPSYLNRYSAAMRLGTFGPQAKEAVPALIKALADPQPNVRAYSAEALGRIGPAARAALPQLEKQSQESDTFARSKAIEAIKRLRPNAKRSSASSIPQQQVQQKSTYQKKALTFDMTAKDKETEAHLKGVLKYDRERAARFDMTTDEIKKASSVKLILHFTASPLKVWFHLYDDRNTGILRAIRASQTLQAFVHRPDMIQAIIDSNKVRLDQVKRMKPGNQVEKGLSLNLMASDELLLYPHVFAKIQKKHEKALLRVMCERYRAMVDANNRFGKEHEPFGASFGPMARIVGQLAKWINPTGNWDRPAIGDEAEWYNRAERLSR